VPTSTNPNPSAGQAHSPRPALSNPPARPIGEGNLIPQTVVSRSGSRPGPGKGGQTGPTAPRSVRAKSWLVSGSTPKRSGRITVRYIIAPSRGQGVLSLCSKPYLPDRRCRSG